MTTPPVPGYDVVVPTIGRPSLHRLLDTLAGQHACAEHPRPSTVVVVDDRAPADHERPLEIPDMPFPVRILRSAGRGPAAARNVGWRTGRAPWVVFLDDDVELPDGWAELLCADLVSAGLSVGGCQARIQVPLPADRPPTDWERNTAGLQSASWITADMAYRREALVTVSGFDERFPRAYREDADLAVRVRDRGWTLVVGRRSTTHPVRPAGTWISLRLQVGAVDDALMRRLHGRAWRRRAGSGRGRFPWHVATVAAAVAAPALAARRQPCATLAAAAVWLGLTADFLRRRVSPGPSVQSPAGAAEFRRMALTSPAIPFAAVWHRMRGAIRHRSASPWPPPLRAVLFDRDGTLVHDLPYNGDPRLVSPVDGARDVVARLRDRGLSVGVVSNQSGVGRGLLTLDQVSAVNAAVDALIGPFDSWQVCPHAPDDACLCRKPGPGLVLGAARELGVAGYECVVVGDIGADIGAAIAAGARPVLVPTAVTLTEEIQGAPETAESLAAAVDLIVHTGGSGRPAPGPGRPR